jgi:hypothetical protein
MQPILQHLFKKNSLHDIPVESLQEITQQFPYFAIGQYLLTKKLQDTKEAGFDDQFQKALVYFNNPLWLQYSLSTATANPADAAAIIFNGGNETTGIDSSNEALSSSHDMIEEVVLHQEDDYQSIPPETASRYTPLELASAEAAPVQKEPASQTIQREEPFTFQAYYTVDYFASQGIKLGQESQQQDKLGKQLKSFTEWLKTMRRLPETSVVEILDKINDSEIVEIAAHSLDEKDVVTEAMAEVLVKQGKVEKAQELYQKLSLQNPHKSAYFAAKSEDLKRH